MTPALVYEFEFPVLRSPVTSVQLNELMMASAHGLVAAQKALNEEARESLKSSQANCIPASAFMLRHCRLRFPAAYSWTARSSGEETSEIVIRPRFVSPTRITVSYLYRPKLQGKQEAYG